MVWRIVAWSIVACAAHRRMAHGVRYWCRPPITLPFLSESPPTPPSPAACAQPRRSTPAQQTAAERLLLLLLLLLPAAYFPPSVPSWRYHAYCCHSLLTARQWIGCCNKPQICRTAFVAPLILHKRFHKLLSVLSLASSLRLQTCEGREQLLPERTGSRRGKRRAQQQPASVGLQS